MASAPTQPASNLAQAAVKTGTTAAASSKTTTAASKATTASSVVVDQHPIIKLGLICLLIWFLVGKVEVVWDKHEQRVFASKSASLQATAQQNQELESANEKLLAEAKAVAQQASTKKTQVQVVTKNQQSVDATATPDALASRWGVLIADDSAVHPIANGYEVTQKGAVETAQALETVSELNIAYTADEQEVAADNNLITGLNSQVAGLQKQNAEEVDVCNAQIASVKAADAVKLHKAKKKYFVIGFVTGFFGGLIGGHNGL